MTNWMAREGARLADNGYHVLPVRPNDKAPATLTMGEWKEMSDWTRYCERSPTDIELDHWSSYPECSIGVAGGNVAAVDIDILDEGLSYRVAEIAAHVLGETPALRFGRKPKRLLVYRTDKPFYSMVRGKIRDPLPRSPVRCLWLPPDTGKDYQWPIGSLSELPLDQLPVITEAQALTFLDEALRILPPEMRTRARPDHQGRNIAGAKEPATREAVADALGHIPNAGPDYNYWLSIGMAIHEALAGDGLDLWHAWSSRADCYDPKQLDKKWPSFGRYAGERVGAGSLFDDARRHGWTPKPGLQLYKDEHAGLAVDFAGLVAKLDARAGRKPADPLPEPEPIRYTVPAGEPGWRRDMTGGLKLFVDHADATAISPQPWIALGAGLAAFGTLAGRRYAGPTDTRSNIYAIGIAESGGGKDYPLRCASLLLSAAELSRMIGGSKIASGQAIVSALEKQASTIFLTDEIGFLMHAVADRKRAPKHATEIIDNLTELYSASDSLFHGTAYANQKERPRIEINNPNLCLFGVTTPKVFWSALTSAHIDDGSLARFLIFQSDDDFPDRRRTVGSKIMPGELVAIARAVAAGPEGHDCFPSGETGLMSANPYRVTYRDDPAARRAAEIEDYGLELLRDQKAKGQTTSIVARLVENTFKIALIRAVSNDPAQPTIGADDLAWSFDIAKQSVDAILEAARSTIADSPEESKRKRLLKMIEDSGAAGIQREALAKTARFVRHRRDLDEMLDLLMDAEEINVLSYQPDGGGRARRTYYAI
jgi:hypothetical protein